MGWERRGGRTYYYTARRVGRRVVKGYVHPLVAPAVALIGDDRRALRHQASDARRRLAAELAVLAAVAPLDAAADGVARAALLAAGCHRPNRGPWRTRRARPAAAPPPAAPAG